MHSGEVVRVVNMLLCMYYPESCSVLSGPVPDNIDCSISLNSHQICFCSVYSFSHCRLKQTHMAGEHQE